MDQQNPEPLFDVDAVNAALKKAETIDDLEKEGGVLQLLMKKTLEALFQGEMDAHLGYGKHDARSKKTSNARNGSYKKTVKTAGGAVELHVPRDRDGKFEPRAVPKHARTSPLLAKKIVSMYARGMTTRDISEHLKEIYMGVEVSPALISSVTEAVMEEVREWQSRTLEKFYAVVYFDAVHFKVRTTEGRVATKAAYICLGIDRHGKKDVLDISVGDAESASFWAGVLAGLSNRGVEDILIACVDGLKGLPEALESVFPKTEVQLCVIHQIRNSLKYVGSTHQKEFMQNLKRVYKAANLDLAESNLEELDKKWGSKYPVVIKSWRNNWDRLATYFKYTDEIRTLIYTTNIVEGHHRQMRKVTKNRSVFPTDKSLVKLLYLATREAQKKWTAPQRGWARIISQLAIHFGDRVPVDLA